MPTLTTDIRAIKGIGEQRAKSLAKLHIATLRDLIAYFPRSYEDSTAVTPSPGSRAGRPPAWRQWWPPLPPSAASAGAWSW